MFVPSVFTTTLSSLADVDAGTYGRRALATIVGASGSSVKAPREGREARWDEAMRAALCGDDAGAGASRGRDGRG